MEYIYIDELKINIIRKNVKNVILKISKEKEITITANKKVSLKYIEDFICSKKSWLIKSLNKFKEINKLNYTTGETIKILNNEYKLLVIEDIKNKYVIEDNIIYLYVKDINNFDLKEKIIYKIYKEIADIKFEEEFNNIYGIFNKYIKFKPLLNIRKMKSKWGSCNRSSNVITLNLELIKCDEECLKYVIIHEYVHFLVAAHNKQFYSYMNFFLPNFKQIKNKLNNLNI